MHSTRNTPAIQLWITLGTLHAIPHVSVADVSRLGPGPGWPPSASRSFYLLTVYAPNCSPRGLLLPGAQAVIASVVARTARRSECGEEAM